MQNVQGFPRRKKVLDVANRKTVFHLLKFTNFNTILPLKALIYKKEVKILSICV